MGLIKVELEAVSLNLGSGQHVHGPRAPAKKNMISKTPTNRSFTMVERYAEVSVEGTRKVQCRITDPSGKERARQILVFLTTVAAIAAACMILAGVSDSYVIFFIPKHQADRAAIECV
jgi:hypothetical protein